MTKFLMFALVAFASTAAAQEAAPLAIPADAEQLLCDVGEVIECWPGNECSSGGPEEVDIPRFVHLDLQAQTISSPSPGFEGASSPLTAVNRQESRIALAGIGRFGRTFSVIINSENGEMNGAVLAGGYSFLLFGGCIVDE